MSEQNQWDNYLPSELAAPARRALDEYRLLVHPLVRGSGKRLFPDGSQATLQLTDTKSFSSGIVLLQYRSQAQEK